MHDRTKIIADNEIMSQGKMSSLDEYYNTFNEDKRLLSRHGRIELYISMHYIHKCLEKLAEELGKEKKDIRILDIGAGTGAYTIPLSEEGYDVTAVEPTHPNLGRLKKKAQKAKVYEGNALKLSRFDDDYFDLIIMFGPMYHLKNDDDKRQAMLQAKRVLSPNGYMFVTYIMNEYAVLTYAFTENHALECIENKSLDENFHCVALEDDLYSYTRTEDMDAINRICSMKKIMRFTQDGPANYMRRTTNAMDEETYELYTKYILSICEREDLFGAAGHVVDVLQK